MNAQEARDILLLYRPGSRNASDPETLEALELAKRDPELGEWLKENLAFHAFMEQGFRKIEPPSDLQDRIFAERKIIRPVPWWNKPSVLAAAAALVLMAAIAAVLLTPAAPDKSFANYRTRMVATVLRQYRMDIVTNDMSQVRQFLARKGAPADYSVPAGLGSRQLTGAGVLRWRNNAVSMVCFDRGDSQMLFLLVMNRTSLPDPPPAGPAATRVRDYETISWTDGDKVYILSGPPEPEFARKYLGAKG